MRQEERSAAWKDAGEGIIEQGLGLGIEGLRRLLHDEHGWVAENGAGQGDPKLLADVERMAHLADRGFVTFGQPLNELVRMRHLGRFDDLRQRIAWVAATDI